MNLKNEILNLKTKQTHLEGVSEGILLFRRYLLKVEDINQIKPVFEALMQKINEEKLKQKGALEFASNLLEGKPNKTKTSKRKMQKILRDMKKQQRKEDFEEEQEKMSDPEDLNEGLDEDEFDPNMKAFFGLDEDDFEEDDYED